MRASTTSSHKTPTAAHTYSPSVPLSVYRELAVELQAAETMLDSLNAQNQQLAQQNQQLRQEIDKAVQTVLHLQQVVDSSCTVSRGSEPQMNPYVRTEPSRTVNAAPRPIPGSYRPPTTVQSAVEGQSLFQKRGGGSVSSDKLFTEQEEGRYRRRPQPENTSEISGWWLMTAMLLIIVTAFGAGFLIVRPLLQSR